MRNAKFRRLYKSAVQSRCTEERHCWYITVNASTFRCWFGNFNVNKYINVTENQYQHTTGPFLNNDESGDKLTVDEYFTSIANQGKQECFNISPFMSQVNTTPLFS